MTLKRWLNSSFFLKFIVLFSLICFSVEIFILTYIGEDTKNYSLTSCHRLEDVRIIDKIAEKLKIFLYLFDEEWLTSFGRNLYYDCTRWNEKINSLGIDYQFTSFLKINRLTKELKKEGFDVIEFYNSNSLNLETSEVILIGIIAKRTSTIFISILYTKEDNTWWFGNIKKDFQFNEKIGALKLSPQNISNVNRNEGLLSKFEAISLTGHKHLLIPRYIPDFLNDFKTSNYISCNTTRAKLFEQQYKLDTSVSAVRFRHRAWKLLAKVKTVFGNLSIPFWLSSGTCLGYFRECNIIPYSKDVDIGVFANNYNYNIISHLEEQQILLTLWLGDIKDSLELSFIDEYGTKLDIFFFYEEEDSFWNGGTQVKSRKKFKYTFPKFDLCWTLFLGLKLRVPCKTEEYIKANYGPFWFIPQVHWDWKSSPYNVKENGIWPISKLSSVIRLHY